MHAAQHAINAKEQKVVQWKIDQFLEEYLRITDDSTYPFLSPSVDTFCPDGEDRSRVFVLILRSMVPES